MDVWLKFIILYLIPVVSFAFAVGTYLFVYGKSLELEKVIINITFFVIILGFIASSFLTKSLYVHFIANHNYIGITFAIIALLIDLVVIGLCLVFFYGVANP